MVPVTGLEPVRPQGAEDFKSAVSAIPPHRHIFISFFNLHIYYIIFFYKNQLRFLMAAPVQNRTDTSRVRAARTDHYTKGQYTQDTFKKSF